MTRKNETRRAQTIDLNGRRITRTVREVESESISVEERNGELEYCERDRGYTVADGWKYMVARVRFFGEEEWSAWRPCLLDGEPVRFRRSRRRSIDEESARWIDRVVLHVADYEERIAFTATDLYRDVFNNCARWFVEKGAGKMPEALEPFTTWDDGGGFYKKRWVGLLHSSLMRLSKDRTPFEALWDVRRGRDVRTFSRTSGRTQ